MPNFFFTENYQICNTNIYSYPKKMMYLSCHFKHAVTNIIVRGGHKSSLHSYSHDIHLTSLFMYKYRTYDVHIQQRGT